MEFPAALSNLREILLSFDDLDTFIILALFLNSKLVIFYLNSNTFFPGSHNIGDQDLIVVYFRQVGVQFYRKKY